MDATPILALVGSIAVGAVSFLGARLGSIETTAASHRKNRFDGDLKIADYRLNWIETLRKEFISLDEIMVDAIFNETVREHEATIKQSSIRFRMNPRDANYRPLLDSIFAFFGEVDQDRKIELRETFIRLSQEVLHTEWDRLKREVRDAGKDTSLPFTPSSMSRPAVPARRPITGA